MSTKITSVSSGFFGSGKLLETTSFDSQELNRSVTFDLISSNSTSPKITKYALLGLEKLL